MTDSLTARVSQAIAQLLAFVGVVAGFWHIMWLAGVGILVGSFRAMMVQCAGYFRLERAVKAAARRTCQAAVPGRRRGAMSLALADVLEDR